MLKTIELKGTPYSLSYNEASGVILSKKNGASGLTIHGMKSCSGC